MANTFDGYQKEFANLGIHFLLAETIKFRKQLTVRDEFKSQSGWDNGLNSYMIKEVEKLADTLENITYNPDTFTQEELEEQAADTTRSLDDDYNENALTSDNVLMFTRAKRAIVWDLSNQTTGNIYTWSTPDRNFDFTNPVFRNFFENSLASPLSPI